MTSLDRMSAFLTNGIDQNRPGVCAPDIGTAKKTNNLIILPQTSEVIRRPISVRGYSRFQEISCAVVKRKQKGHPNLQIF